MVKTYQFCKRCTSGERNTFEVFPPELTRKARDVASVGLQVHESKSALPSITVNNINKEMRINRGNVTCTHKHIYCHTNKMIV